MAPWPVPSLLVILTQLRCVSLFRFTPETVGFQSDFSAARTSSLLGGSQKAVTFDRFLLNVGHDFNPDTGVFRCRVSGTYYFSYTVGKFPKKLLSVMLVKNRQEVQDMVYNDRQRKDRKVQSQSVTISLSAKDTARLLCRNSPTYALYRDAGPYVTFNGHLVPLNSYPSYPDTHLAMPWFNYPDCPLLGGSRQSQVGNKEQPRSAFSVAGTISALGTSLLQEEKPALTFDVEHVNVGGHFAKSSGRFNCRFPAAYYFAFTVGKHPERVLSVKLMTVPVRCRPWCLMTAGRSNEKCRVRARYCPRRRGTARGYTATGTNTLTSTETKGATPPSLVYLELPESKSRMPLRTHLKHAHA